MSTRRQRIAETEVLDQLADIEALKITVDETAILCSWRQTYVLANRHNLTLYDAAYYVELALRRSVSLATLDRKLAAEAAAEGIEVIGGG